MTGSVNILNTGRDLRCVRPRVVAGVAHPKRYFV